MRYYFLTIKNDNNIGGSIIKSDNMEEFCKYVDLLNYKIIGKEEIIMM